VRSAFLCYAKAMLSFKKAQAKSQYIINSLFFRKIGGKCSPLAVVRQAYDLEHCRKIHPRLSLDLSGGGRCSPISQQWQ